MVSPVDYLEDGFSDVISKAQRGLRLTTAELASRTGVGAQAIRALRSGEGGSDAIGRLAPQLGLREAGLHALAEGSYRPVVGAVEGFVPFDTPAPRADYAEMRVNAYLCSAPGSEEVVLIDSSADPDAVLGRVRESGKRLTTIFITHMHWDHVDGVPAILAEHPEAKVFVPAGAPVGDYRPLGAGSWLERAGLEIEVRSTPGHLPQGLTFVVHGLRLPIAIVGDSLFAGSIGGIAPEAYEAGLRAMRRELFTLEDATVLAPGHGRLSTVGYERAHNPFFP